MLVVSPQVLPPVPVEHLEVDPSSGRTPNAVIAAQLAFVGRLPHVASVIDELPFAAALLNPQREILHANPALRAVTGSASVLGLRAAEVAQLHRSSGECRPHCPRCAVAARLALAARAPVPERGAWRFLTVPAGNGDPRDGRVRVSRLRAFDTLPLMLAVLEGVGEPPPRRSQGPLSVPDVLDTAAGVHGYLQLWEEMTAEELSELGSMVRLLSRPTLAELITHRQVARAERGKLQVEVELVDIGALLGAVCAELALSPVGAGRQLQVRCGTGSVAGQSPSPEPTIATDPILLRQVATELVWDALAASGSGQRVTVRWNPAARRVSVHDEVVRPPARRTPTSATGGTARRGSRIVSERYLGGEFECISSVGFGTSCRLTLPAVLAASASA